MPSRPVWLTFWSFRLMIGMAFLMLIYLIAMATYSLQQAVRGASASC